MQKKILPIILILLVAVFILASCSDSTFTVTYEVDGQTFTTMEVKKGGKLNMPTAPVKSGYNFDGWYLDNEVWTQPFNSSVAVINDITVYAHFIKVIENIGNTYVITFDSQGGSEVPGLRVKEGTSFTLPDNPTLQDYNFAGWFLDSACTVPFTVDYELTRSITVYAKWTPVDSTTYFTLTGSTITSLSEMGKKAQTITFPKTIDGVEVTAIGENLFKNNVNVKSVTFPSGSSYNTIGAYAFSGCTSLTEIKFINGISTIGEGAFSGCTALKNLQLPTSITQISKNLFSGCTSLQYATIYESITSIGDNAYKDCSAITSVRIRANVLSVGANAFSGCTAMRSVGIDEGVKSIGEKAFYNNAKLTEIIIPNSVESLGAYAFYNATSLTSATLSANITAVPDYLFFGAKLLETLTIPVDSKITSIGECAFNGCTELENFFIPSGITEISQRAFEGCKDITSFIVPQGVTKLNSQTFLNAVNLTSVTLHENVTELGNFVFGGCVELTTVSGLGGVTKMGSGVFRNCLKLDNITIPATLETLSDATFESCIALKTVVLSDGVKVIERNAFKDCVELESITLPLTLTKIGENAFYGNTKLNNVYIPSLVSLLYANTFDNCTSLTEIAVASDNPYFKAENGVIYAKDGSALIFYSDALTATTFVIPDGVKVLYPYAFDGKGAITSITAPDSLEEIGAYAFRNNIALANFNFTKNLKSIGQNAFESTTLTSVTLPLGLHTIDKYAFKNTFSLLTINIPITTLSIGEGVFEGCRSTLQISVEGDEEDLSGWSGNWDRSQSVRGFDITYAQGRITSGEYRYFQRDNLAVLTDYFGSDTVVTVPEVIDGYKVMGLYKTFRNKNTITEITVPNSVEIISELSFKGMSALTTMTLPFVGGYRGADGVEGIFGYAFDYSESSVDEWTRQYAEGGSLSRYYVDLPKTITSVTLTDCETIAYGAFSLCHNLEEIVLPDNIEEIKGKAFYQCSLVEVYLPLSLKVVGLEAFTINFNRNQDVSEGALSPQVTFNCAAAERPSGWIEGAFDEKSKFNYAVA